MRRPLLLSLLVLAACGKSPAQPTVEPCVTNNTAQLAFGNRAQATTHDVFLDGARIVTLTPGQDSPRQTVAAGVQHTVEFRITNTGIAACQPSTPVLAQCSDRIITCAFP